MRRLALALALALALIGLPAAAHDPRLRLPLSALACRDGSPQSVWVVNAISKDDCSAGGGTLDNRCCCLDGSWVDCDPEMLMGEINFAGNSTATVITTTSAYTRVGITATLSMAMDFDSPQAGRLRYTGIDTAMAHCGVTFSVKSAGSGDLVRALLYQNGTVNGNNEYTGGTALTAGTTVHKLAAGGDTASTAIHVMPTLAPDDYLELAVMNASDGDDLTVTDMNIFCVALAGH